MPTFTTFLNLLKPNGSEFVNEVTQLNDNWDDIDTFASGTDTRLDTAEANITALQAGQVPMLKAVKTADTNRTSTTTLTDDPHLVIPVANTSRYSFEAFWQIQTENNALWSGQLVVPGTGKVMLRHQHLGNVSSDYNVGPRRGYSPIYSDNMFFVNVGDPVGVINIQWSLHVTGYFITNAAGDVKLQWAQSASDVDDVIMLEGSYMRLLKLS